MSKIAWRILLTTFFGCVFAATTATLLNGVVSSRSALRGTLLHEAPFIFSVIPAFVGLLALGYVGGRLLVRGRDAMPERPRLVTWLILANFLVPIGSFAVMVTTLWLDY
jgi:hypothetical protein